LGAPVVESLGRLTVDWRQPGVNPAIVGTLHMSAELRASAGSRQEVVLAKGVPAAIIVGCRERVLVCRGSMSRVRFSVLSRRPSAPP
jgi:hypothetical protein